MSKPDLGNKKCFVIMPFGSRKREFKEWGDYYKTSKTEYDHWHNVYENIIVESVEKSGFELECIRVDQEKGPNDWDDEVICHMVEDYIAIIDISTINTNVYWELGVRHALGNRNIIITSNRDNQASDIWGQKSLEYSLTDITIRKQFFEDIKDYIANIMEEPNKKRNRVQKILKTNNLIYHNGEKQLVDAKNQTNDLGKFKKRINNLLRIMEFEPHDSNCPKYNKFSVSIAQNRDEDRALPLALGQFFPYLGQKKLYFIYDVIDSKYDWKDVQVDAAEIGGRYKSQKDKFSLNYIIPYAGQLDKRESIIGSIKQFLRDRLDKNGLMLMHVQSQNPQTPIKSFLEIEVEIWDLNEIDRIEKIYGLINTDIK